MVGLEETFFRVSEDIGLVELCVNVSSPDIDCPIEFPFQVRLSTSNGAAGMIIYTISKYTLSSNYDVPTVAFSDYESLDVVVMFSECQRRKCVNVTIVDDSKNEPNKNFIYHLEETPVGLHPNIDLRPVDGEIVIEDNDGK